MNEQQIKELIAKSLKDLRSDRQTLFEQSLPLLADLEKEGRSFFITIATIAGAILAFSFVPLQNEMSDIIKCRSLFLLGEGLLAIDIIFSVIAAFSLWKKNFIDLHKTYYDQFFRFTRCIELSQKFLTEGAITEQEQQELKNEVETVEKRLKNEPDGINVIYQWVAVGLFVAAMTSLILSFLISK